jgi:hypothetical protein
MAVVKRSLLVVLTLQCLAGCFTQKIEKETPEELSACVAWDDMDGSTVQEPDIIVDLSKVMKHSGTGKQQ